jgi:hypothetical protein
MSSLIFKSEDMLIYDDVLSDTDFANLFRHLNNLQYTSVHADYWHKVWRLHDGQPLTGKAGWYYREPPENRQKSLFPTMSAMDPLVQWIVERVPEIESVIGPSVSRLKCAPDILRAS